MNLVFVLPAVSRRQKTLADVPDGQRVIARRSDSPICVVEKDNGRIRDTTGYCLGGPISAWIICDIDGNIEYIDDTPPLPETLEGAEPGTVWECCIAKNESLRFIAIARGKFLFASVIHNDGRHSQIDDAECRPLRYIGKLEITE